MAVAISKGNRFQLSKAITLIESTRYEMLTTACVVSKEPIKTLPAGIIREPKDRRF